MSYDSWAALEMVLAADLSAAAGAPVEVMLESLPAFEARGFDRFLGSCIDTPRFAPRPGCWRGRGRSPSVSVSTAIYSGACAP